jgi:uncharacterized protein YcbK (DUF882 family)
MAPFERGGTVRDRYLPSTPKRHEPASGLFQLARRRLLRTLAAAPLAPLALPGWTRAAQTHPAGGCRALEFLHLHTGERLAVEYFSAGQYVPDALQAVNHLLRDFRTGDVAEMDPGLLDVLHRLRETTGSRQPFQIISAYRSPQTNEMLRGRHARSGVATTSLHMRGQAIDIRLGDVALIDLRNAALSLQAGGVGYYPRSNFVHVDTGRVRSW